MRRPFVLPGARPHYARDREVDVEHIRLEVRLDPDRGRVEGTCSTTVTPILEGARTLELDAVELEILAVRLAGLAPLAYRYDGRRLSIDLGAPLKAGERATIAVEYAATPRRGLYFVGPDDAYPDRPRQVWSQGQDEDSRNWFPCFDAPHEKATSEVIATVPASFTVVSNGDLVEVRPGTGAPGAPPTRTFHHRLEAPHSCYLVTLAAGEFAEIVDRWEDVEVRYLVERGREAEARRTLGRTPEMLALFSERFGVRYPWRSYAQVVVAEFIFGGMENTTAATLTDAILLDERAALDLDFESLVAHELAHQWFGDLLTCRDWSQGWLNEGFATYAEYVWQEHARGRDEAALTLAGFARDYLGEDEDRYRRPVATNVYDEPLDLFDHHLYEKAACVLHMLRRLLGDAPFWRAIAAYVRAHQGGSVETRDLARSIEAATGRNVDWFLEQWIARAGHPELEVEYAWDAGARLARLVVRQVQKVEGDTPLFRLPAGVRFRVDGRDVDRPLEIREAHQVFHFPLDAEPEQAILDPGGHQLKRLKTDKPRTLWLAELARATEAADRIAATRPLAKDGAPDAIEALVSALRDDAFWGVRAAAADALGQARGRRARDALIDALPTTHPKVRRAIVRALGEFRADDRAAEALARVVADGDASCFVEAEACLALGRTRSPRAAALLRQAAARDSWQDTVRGHAYRGLAEARDEAALPLLLEATGRGRAPAARRAAVAALAKLFGGGRRDREAALVRDHLEALLEDPDFRLKRAVIDALAELADPRSAAALRRLTDRELDRRLRRRGREVLRDLEEGSAREDGIRALRDELDRLRREVGALRERLDRADAQARPPATTPPPSGRPPPAAATTPPPGRGAPRAGAERPRPGSAPPSEARPRGRGRR